MTRLPTGLLGVTLGLTLLSACSSTTPPKPSRSASLTSPSPVASGSSRVTVANYFSPPPPHPGPAWTKNARSVSWGELNISAGPEHCNWQSAVFMSVGWPLGTVARRATEAHRFIRDPNGVVSRELRNALVTAIDLPIDARDTGYRNGDLELWFSPTDPDSAYLRVKNDVERWPRNDSEGCD
jgi:hypothetical protein